MALIDLTDWLNEFSGHQYAWFVKRLSGNDTLANKAHQAGPYLPKKFAFEMFPTIETIKEKNLEKHCKPTSIHTQIVLKSELYIIIASLDKGDRTDETKSV